MSIKALQQGLLENLKDNLLIRLAYGLISAIAAYLEFRDAGWTLLFWVLVVLALGVVLSVAIQWVWKRIKEKQVQLAREVELQYDHQRKIEMLNLLIDDFRTIEKAKRLQETLDPETKLRVLTILPVEGKLGVVVNVGKANSAQVGTQLVIYRRAEYTSRGEHIEERLGLVQITYVQAGNNCSQAVVIGRHDRDFWDTAATKLEQEKRVTPPANFVMPYIPEELQELTSEKLRVLRQYLVTIHDSLTRAEFGY
jgi:hypothetical protein